MLKNLSQIKQFELFLNCYNNIPRNSSVFYIFCHILQLIVKLHKSCKYNIPRISSLFYIFSLKSNFLEDSNFSSFIHSILAIFASLFALCKPQFPLQLPSTKRGCGYVCVNIRPQSPFPLSLLPHRFCALACAHHSVSAFAISFAYFRCYTFHRPLFHIFHFACIAALSLPLSLSLSCCVLFIFLFVIFINAISVAAS